MSEESTIKADADRTATLPDSSHDPRLIDHYRLLQKLGEGGMGEVWEAEQMEPVQRRVALKLIKRGMDSTQVIARFETERQALALMDHPAIAKVFDAGTTRGGRPYFVMELIHGVPITDYCDRHRLTVRQRLDLFIQVCEGIQHAHQKAIIHRDIKPSNILITEQDGSAVPKVIDFGVAKATSQRLTERTLFTELGQLIGTPEYMSPEQAELTSEDVDIRTDVYSLGMVLYELLVGALPFDPEELRQAGLLEIQRKIRDEEPAKPSTRVTRLAPTSTATARNRRTTPPALAKSLRGDLDWIVMKALDKDRRRRYETAHAFALEIERFLGDQIVTARPPRTAYRVGKFVRRHRLGVAASVGLLLMLLLGIAGTIAGMVRARRAEARAVQDAEAAQQVSDFLVDLFKVSDPGEARGDTVTAREILDRGAERIAALGDQPLVQSRLQLTMAKVYQELGMYRQAIGLAGHALATRREWLGEPHELVAESLHQSSQLHRKQGELERAEILGKQALEMRQAVLRADHPDVVRSLDNLAVLYENWGKFDLAEPLFEQSLAIQDEEGSPELDQLDTLVNLAILQAKQGRVAESEALFRRALAEDEERYGPDHPEVAISSNNLAIALKMQEKYGEAEPLYRRALEIQEKVLGPDHTDLAMSLNNLANLYLHLERLAEAEALYQRAVAVNEKALGPDHPDVGRNLYNLACLYYEQGRFGEAEALHSRALKIRRAAFGSQHPEVAGSLHDLANLYREQEQWDRSERCYLEAIDILSAVLDSDHPDLQTARSDYAEQLRRVGRDAEAATLEAGG